MMNEAHLTDTISAHRALAAGGQADLVWGHAAVRDPLGRGVWSKAAGWGLEEVTADRLVLVDFEGTQIEGTGRRHIECFIHTELMKRRPDIVATVHTHSEAATAFAALDTPMRALSHDAVPFLTPDVSRYEISGDLISDSVRGASLAEVIQLNAGCIIPGHGLVTAGRSVAAAVMNAMLLDRACRLQLKAMAAGQIARYSSDEEVRAKQQGLWTEAQLAAGFQYLVRKARALYGDDQSPGD